MLSIFEFEFMQRALLAGTLVSILAPLVGIFIVIRRYSPLADSLSHVSLVGVALGLILNTSPLLFASIVTVASSIGIEKIRSTQKSFSESILVLFTTGSLGLATIITSLNRNFTSSLDGFLFGSLSTVTSSDILLISISFVIVLTIFLFSIRKFFVISLDEEIAQTNKIKTSKLNYILMVISALIISISIRTVGVLLISSLMIIPVISSLQLKLNFKFTLISAVIISILSVWVGLFASFYLNLPSGGTIAVLNMLVYLILLFWKRLE